MSKGPFRPIYLSLLHHPRFVGLSTNTRSLWFALKLRLGPSGLDRVYRDELCAIANLDPARLDVSERKLIEMKWLQVEGNLYWLVDGYENEPMAQGPKSRTSIERHMDGFRGKIVDNFKERYGFDTHSDRVPDGASYRSVRGERERDREEGKGKEKTIGGNVGIDYPLTHPPNFEVLSKWLGNPAVCMRAEAKWGGSTPTWPTMILDRFGPEGIDPKPPALILHALSDLIRKTAGILHTRSLEAFVNQTEGRNDY